MVDMRTAITTSTIVKPERCLRRAPAPVLMPVGEFLKAVLHTSRLEKQLSRTYHSACEVPDFTLKTLSLRGHSSGWITGIVDVISGVSPTPGTEGMKCIQSVSKLGWFGGSIVN